MGNCIYAASVIPQNPCWIPDPDLEAAFTWLHQVWNAAIWQLLLLPHLGFQGSQKNFWRAPTLNKAISDLKEKKNKKGKKSRVQFNTGNWQRFKLHLILAKAVHQSWGEMWIFSSSQMPNYSLLLILLLRSCQGCTHPSISRHLNTTQETSEPCDVQPGSVTMSPLRNPCRWQWQTESTSCWNDAASCL